MNTRLIRSSGPHRACSPQAAFRYVWPEASGARLEKVISGANAGVERAALDAAVAQGYEAGGSTARYPQRASLNVRDGDATLILHAGAQESDTRLIERIAERMGKPWLVVHLGDRAAFDVAKAWLEETSPRVLHVAGPRESRDPGHYARSYALLVRLLGPARQ